MNEKTRKEFTQLICEKLLLKFSELGFVKIVKDCLISKHDLYNDKLLVTIDEKYFAEENIYSITFNYLFERRFEIVEKYWEHYLKDLGYNINPAGYKCTTININHFNIEYPDNYWTKRYYIDSKKYNNIDDFIEKFWDEYSLKMIPIMNSTDSIKKLDLIINNENELPRFIFNGTGGLMKRMIIAKLAGNPNYEKVCQEVLEAIELKKETEPKKYDGFKYVYGEIIKKLESVEEYME